MAHDIIRIYNIHTNETVTKLIFYDAWDSPTELFESYCEKCGLDSGSHGWEYD